MIKYVKGDIVKSKYPVFCQQVNCKGVMGSGLAKQIRDKYPGVYESYRVAHESGRDILGSNHYVYLDDGRVCVCMYAQNEFGRDKQYTDYKAFLACLNGLEKFCKWYAEKYTTIAFPYKIGCGLGGGDWTVISDMIEKFSERVPQRVYIMEKE